MDDLLILWELNLFVGILLMRNGSDCLTLYLLEITRNNLCIYIYIERERESELSTDVCTQNTHVYTIYRCFYECCLHSNVSNEQLGDKNPSQRHCFDHCWPIALYFSDME